MKYTLKYATKSKHDKTKDFIWIATAATLIFLMVLFGYDLLTYVATHNILRGEF